MRWEQGWGVAGCASGTCLHFPVQQQRGPSRGPASANPSVGGGGGLHWELAQDQGRHMKGASLPSHTLGREEGTGALRAPGGR